MGKLSKIAVGGGCHWCTEAVFQSLQGVSRVEQGFVASEGSNSTFSEAVIVYFDNDLISLKTIIQVHLKTHKSTSLHSMRQKYRSAIYTFSEAETELVTGFINEFQADYNNELITKVLAFREFKASREEITNYYLKDPKKPFCQNYIIPKLELLKKAEITNLKVDFQ